MQATKAVRKLNQLRDIFSKFDSWEDVAKWLEKNCREMTFTQFSDGIPLAQTNRSAWVCRGFEEFTIVTEVAEDWIDYENEEGKTEYDRVERGTVDVYLGRISNPDDLEFIGRIKDRFLSELFDTGWTKDIWEEEI